MRSKEIFNWKEYEELLYEGLHEAIKRVTQTYPDIEFYGMCIDCNAEYGEVLLHLNTEDGIEGDEKWDVGAWEKYFDVFDNLQENDNFFDNSWEEKREYIIENMSSEQELDEGEIPVEDFMVMISEVAIKLETSDAIARLKKKEQVISVLLQLTMMRTLKKASKEWKK